MKTKMPEPALTHVHLAGDKFSSYFTQSQLRAAMVAAFNEAIEHCARLSEGHYGDGQRLAEIIRTYKETP